MVGSELASTVFAKKLNGAADGVVATSDSGFGEVECSLRYGLLVRETSSLESVRRKLIRSADGDRSGLSGDVGESFLG